MVFINTLPDLCLVNIFASLPLRDQLQLKLVCNRWALLQPITINKRKSIIILVGDNADRLVERCCFGTPHSDKLIDDDGSAMFAQPCFTEWNSLRLARFNEDTVRGLSHMLTGITTLRIALNEVCVYQLCFVAVWLQALSDKLITLQLHCNFAPLNIPIPQQVSDRIFASINSMNALKNLSMDIRNIFACVAGDPIANDPGAETTALELTILPQLEKFHFASIDTDERGDLLWDSLCRFGERNPQGPLQICYGNGIAQSTDKHKWLALNAQFCARFTNLVHHSFTSLDMAPICDRFTSLTCVDFKTDGLRLHQITTNLSRLSQLAFVRLHFTFPAFREDNKQGDAVYQLKALPSVKVLEIDLSMDSHQDIAFLQIAHIFPAVQVIELEVYKLLDNIQCSLCGFYLEWQHCQAQLCKPLTRCRRLHTLNISSSMSDFEPRTVCLNSLRNDVY